jgi:hypothetical protein
VPGGKEPVLFVVDVCPDVLDIPGDFWVVGGLRVDGGGNTKLYSIVLTLFAQSGDESMVMNQRP